MITNWCIAFVLKSGIIYQMQIGDLIRYQGCALDSHLRKIEFPIVVEGVSSPQNKFEHMKAAFGFDHRRCFVGAGYKNEENQGRCGRGG